MKFCLFEIKIRSKLYLCVSKPYENKLSYWVCSKRTKIVRGRFFGVAVKFLKQYWL